MILEVRCSSQIFGAVGKLGAWRDIATQQKKRESSRKGSIMKTYEAADVVVCDLVVAGVLLGSWMAAAAVVVVKVLV